MFFNVKVELILRKQILQPDEVIKPIAERITPGYLTSLNDFTAAVQKDASFRPFGEMQRRFTIDLGEYSGVH